MKVSLNVLLVILFLFACEQNKKGKNDWPFENVANNFRSASGILVTHKLSLSCDGIYLPARKRMLNKSELTMSNSGTEQARLFNDSTIIAYLYNNCPVELIDESADFYKVKFDIKNQITEGFILKSYCGTPTIKPFIDQSHSLGNSNLITNPELLPYCRVFVTEKFHNLLVQGSKSQNPLKHLSNIFADTQSELILFSLFVGQSERRLYRNNDRPGGDATHLQYCVKNDYYTYDFSNYGNMFAVTSPSLPEKISSFSILNDTLKATIVDVENSTSKRNIKLYPLDIKSAYTSRNGPVWILNDSIRMKDISYIADALSVRETQVGHAYFYTILEHYIQDILPK